MLKEGTDRMVDMETSMGAWKEASDQVLKQISIMQKTNANHPMAAENLEPLRVVPVSIKLVVEEGRVRQKSRGRCPLLNNRTFTDETSLPMRHRARNLEPQRVSH